MKRLIIYIAIAAVAFGVARLIVANNNPPEMSRQSYLNVQEKACIDEAIKEPSITHPQATQYCKCVAVKIFGDKPMSEMRETNTQLLTGVLTPQQEDIIVECANAAMR